MIIMRSSSMRTSSIARYIFNIVAASISGSSPTCVPSGAITRWRRGSGKSSSSVRARNGSAGVSSAATMLLRHLHHQPVGRLEQPNHRVGERGADVPVDQAVIEGERQVHHVADDDLIVPHHGPLTD